MAKRKQKKKTKKASGAQSSSQINRLRRQIDRCDMEIVRLLNERASVVVQIGEVKRDQSSPIYSPDRERAVLQHIAHLNHGPLPRKALQAIYREVMSGSYALEKPLRIAYLGPEGTYSHQAAMRKFGASVEYLSLPDIPAIFEEVARKHCSLGVVPIENTLGGGVVDTLDCFAHSHVPICAEILLEIHHNLLTKGPTKKIKRIYSRPEVFAQCREWLSSQFRDAELIPMASSARAAEQAARSTNGAALGSELAAKVHGLRVAFAHVEDNPHNMTRFLVLSDTPAKPTGNDRTAMMFTTRHKAGALVDVLNVFSRSKINLSSIDSRPTRRRNWAYYFFIEAEGHIDDPRLAKAIEQAGQHCGELHVLGSFPRDTTPV